MSIRHKQKRRARYFIQRNICQRCGAQNANHYWLPETPLDQKPDDVLCGKCASLWYCLSCGNFSAGCEGFDFLHPGLCDNCRHDPDLSDYDEEDDYGDDL